DAVDHHRLFRQGMAETILCEGKTQAQVLGIATRLRRHGHPVLATRVDPGIARALLRFDRRAHHDPIGRTVVLDPPKGWGGKARRAGGEVLIITAGTSGISLAADARAAAHIRGNTVTTMNDV